MRLLSIIAVALLTLALIGCGKPTVPESPDVESYGHTIEPDHNIPEEHR